MLKIFISPKETIQPETDPNVQAIIVEMQNEKVELWKDNERLKAENRYQRNQISRLEYEIKKLECCL